MPVINENDIIVDNETIVEVAGLKIGDVVVKHSGKPFKEGYLFDTIEYFTMNPNFPINLKRPLNGMGAFLNKSKTIVCVTMVQKYITECEE